MRDRLRSRRGIAIAVFLAAASAAHAQGVVLPEAMPPIAPGGASLGGAGPAGLPAGAELSTGEPGYLQSSLPSPAPLDAAVNSGAPVPYNKDEFPGWLRDIRRAEVITIGAFPITLLFSSLGYQVYRSLTGVTTPITQPEQIRVLLGGVGLAATVALVDFILGKIQPPPKEQEAP